MPSTGSSLPLSGFFRSAFIVSTQGSTGMTAVSVSAASNILAIMSHDSRGRTPSWMATTAPSGIVPRAFFTEWKRVSPPFTMVWGQMKLVLMQYSFHLGICASGRTVITFIPGTAAMNFSIDRRRIALPPISRNCFGISVPILVPLPPATATSIFCLALLSISCKFKNCFGISDRQQIFFKKFL